MTAADERAVDDTRAKHAVEKRITQLKALPVNKERTKLVKSLKEQLVR